MIVFPGRPSPSFRSGLDRFHDSSSYRKGRCKREENEYGNLGPCKYDRPSMMELQQSRPKTMGRILGGSSGHRATVPRKGCDWYPGRQGYPNLGPGVYHQASRLFLSKEDTVVLLPGSRGGFHSFINSGRSKRLMGDAVLFKTARCAGKHLGPGSYDLSSTLNNGTRPSTASESTVRHARPSPRPRTSSGDQRGARGAQQEGRAISAWRGVRQLPEERTADVEAVKALPALW